MKRNKKLLVLYIIIIIFLALLFILFSVRSYQHYSAWKEHRNYSKNLPEKIEPWMNFKTISIDFNIQEKEILNISGVNATSLNQGMNLELFCKQYKKNCTELVNTLNNLNKRDDNQFRNN